MQSDSIPLDDFIRQYHEKHNEPYTPHTGERFVNATEYARMSGISPVAVRERVKRGLLAGEKIGSRWMVKVIQDAPPADTAEIELLKAKIEVLELKLKLIKDIMEAGEHETP